MDFCFYRHGKIMKTITISPSGSSNIASLFLIKVTKRQAIRMRIANKYALWLQILSIQPSTYVSVELLVGPELGPSIIHRAAVQRLLNALQSPPAPVLICAGSNEGWLHSRTGVRGMIPLPAPAGRVSATLVTASAW